jgi:GT2 family glycosyltransferase
MNQKSNELVSVIIVTTGKYEYLQPCLESVSAQTYPEFEIIIIDNLHNPLLQQKILNDFKEINLFLTPENLFYCAALNKGIEMSKGEFILCLNDDVILDKKFIDEALRGFSIDNKVGLVSGKILRFDKKTIDSTGLFLNYWRTAKERGYGCKDKGQFEKEEFIFGVNGAVAFYRKMMLEDIREGNEYFDTDFHIFYEDLDIAWRAKRFGWKGYYIPSALAYHLRGGTVRQGKGVNNKYGRRYLNNELHTDLIKNRYLAMIKNESALDFLLHLPGILLYDLIIWAYILLFKPQLIKTFLLNLKFLKAGFKKRRLYSLSRRKTNRC